MPLPSVNRTSQLSNKFATILLYAKAKLGKTQVAGRTAPKPLILANETGDTHGLQSVRDLDLPYIVTRDWEETELVIAELNKVPNILQYNGEEYQSLIVDSFSGCGRFWLDLALKKLGRKEVGMSEPGWDPRRPYAYVAEKGRQAMKKFMALRAHIILICREGVAEEGEGDDKSSFPCVELPGSKLYKELPGDPDATVRLIVKNGLRVLVTQPEHGAIAGVRSPGDIAIPRYCKPDLTLLIKAMLGDRSAAEALDAKPPKEPSVVNLSRR